MEIKTPDTRLLLLKQIFEPKQFKEIVKKLRHSVHDYSTFMLKNNAESKSIEELRDILNWDVDKILGAAEPLWGMILAESAARKISLPMPESNQEPSKIEGLKETLIEMEKTMPKHFPLALYEIQSVRATLSAHDRPILPLTWVDLMMMFPGIKMSGLHLFSPKDTDWVDPKTHVIEGVTVFARSGKDLYHVLANSGKCYIIKKEALEKNDFKSAAVSFPDFTIYISKVLFPAYNMWLKHRPTKEAEALQNEAVKLEPLSVDKVALEENNKDQNLESIKEESEVSIEKNIEEKSKETSQDLNTPDETHKTQETVEDETKEIIEEIKENKTEKLEEDSNGWPTLKEADPEIHENLPKDEEKVQEIKNEESIKENQAEELEEDDSGWPKLKEPDSETHGNLPKDKEKAQEVKNEYTIKENQAKELEEDDSGWPKLKEPDPEIHENLPKDEEKAQEIKNEDTIKENQTEEQEKENDGWPKLKEPDEESHENLIDDENISEFLESMAEKQPIESIYNKQIVEKTEVNENQNIEALIQKVKDEENTLSTNKSDVTHVEHKNKNEHLENIGISSNNIKAEEIEKKSLAELRKERSIRIISQTFRQIPDSIPVGLEDDAVILRPAAAVVWRCRALMKVISHAGGFSLNEEAKSSGVNKDQIEDILGKNLQKRTTPNEIKFLENENPDEASKALYAWKIEGLAILLRALGILKRLPAPDSQVDESICFNLALESLIKKDERHTLSLSEAAILDLLDLYRRLYSISVKNRKNKQGMTFEVIKERRHALEWLIGATDKPLLEWDEISMDIDNQNG